MKPFSPLDHLFIRRLPNGLRVYLKEDHASPLVSVQAWLRVGSVDEEGPQAGISHVIEHMVFKGTARRAAADVSRWVESLGGSINAETSHEYTHYYIDVPSPGSRDAVRLLGEMMHEATLAPEEWQRECPVILEEMKRRNDDPDALLWDLLGQAVYKDPRLSRPVIGDPETVGSLSRDDLYAYYRNFYTASRCVLVIVGDFDPDQMFSWVTTAFQGMPSGLAFQRPDVSAARPAARELKIRKPVQQSYLALAFSTPPSGDPDHEALDLLATVLGEGRSSRLVDDLREKKKIAWSVSAANITHEGPGLFAVFAECEPKRRARLNREIAQHIAGLSRRGPTPGEITRAKNIILNAWLQSYETYHNQASTIGLFAIEGHLDRLKDYLPRIARLTRAQLEPVIDRYFDPKTLASAVVENGA